MSAAVRPEPGTREAQVRAARASDIPRVFELMRELAIYERMEDDLTSTPERFAAHLFDPDAWPRVECLVAETADGIVGYAVFYGCYSSFSGKPLIWLEDVCVTKSARGSGAGFALMRALASIAVERGCGRIEWAVLDWNQPSIDFYERLGAERNTEWHEYAIDGKAMEELAKSSRSG